MARKRKWVNLNPDGSGWYARNGHIYDIPPWVPETPDLPANPLDAVARLRTSAIGCWEGLAMPFGTCTELVARQWLPRKEHRMLADCLLYLELLIRRIVMIAALAYAHLKPAKTSTGPWSTDSWRQRELSHDPTSWRVSFSMLRSPRSARQRYKRNPDPPRLRPAMPLARRIEAIRRVLSYIPGYAKRFARRMQRLRAHNARANQPKLIELSTWDFHPGRRTLGKWGVNDAMTLAAPLSQRAVDILTEPG